MAAKSFKIIFDTNAVFKDNAPLRKVFSNSLSEVRKILQDNKEKTRNVSLLIPELVVAERVLQRCRQIEGEIAGIKDSLNALGCFKKIRPVDREIESIDYEKVLELEAGKFLRANGVGIIKTAKLDNRYIIERALKKVKPFSKGDNGFKDTVIWLSILKDAESDSNRNNYVLCCRDKKGFEIEDLKKEFQAFSERELTIKPDVGELKVYLDKELVLGRHLERLHERIKEGLMGRSGTIMEQVMEHLANGSGYPQNAFAHETMVYDESTFAERPHCLDYSGMEVVDIVPEERPNVYWVGLDLKVKDVSKRKRPSLAQVEYCSVSSGYTLDVYFDYRVGLRYFCTEGKIEVVSVTRNRDNAFATGFPPFTLEQ